MSEAGAPLVVACAADGAYALPLAVMLRSAAAHLDPSLRLLAHVVDGGLDERQRRNVEAALGDRGDVRWHAPRVPATGALPLWGRIAATTYERLFLGDWLPAVTTRAIWLDCDLLVRADLRTLWRMEMKAPRVALAARDQLVPSLASRFGVAAHRELVLASDAPYLNSGVLLIDPALWRREKIGERAIDYLRRFGARVTFWDQEALNVALAGRWGELDGRWNRNPTFARMLARDGEAETDSGPWIVHYSGRLKPWRHPGACPHEAEFLAHLDATAWAGWRPRRSLRSRALAAYAGSRLRRRLFGLEQTWTTALRLATRRLSPPPR